MWKDWDGSADYPPNVGVFTPVKIILRCGYENESSDASTFHWRWYEIDDQPIGTAWCDIVQYMIMEKEKIT